MSLILFLLGILILLGVVVFVSMYVIMRDGEEKHAYSQLVEEANKFKNPTIIKDIYAKDRFKKNKFEFIFDNENIKIKDIKNRRNLLCPVDNILEIKKEYNGEKIDIPSCDFVWSNYGITIKYRENSYENTVTYWFNESDDSNKFKLIDNIETSIMIDAIIYKTLKLKNVA